MSIQTDFILFYSVLTYVWCICPLFILRDGLVAYFPNRDSGMSFSCVGFSLLCTHCMLVDLAVLLLHFQHTVVKTTLHAD